jgi:hypothetical protein
MRLPLQNISAAFFAALLFSGCAARPTIYSPPDASKVVATTKRLSAAIEKQNQTTVRAEARVVQVQASSDKIAGHSASVLQLIRELKPLIPAELKPKFDQLEQSADAQILEEGNLAVAASGAKAEIEQLKKDNAGVVKERDQLVNVDFPNYQAAAKKTADAATAESREKVEYKNQLTSQKILKWVLRLGGGAVVIAIIVLFVTGKISIAAIRTYFRV